MASFAARWFTSVPGMGSAGAACFLQRFSGALACLQNMLRYSQSMWWHPLIVCSFAHFCCGPGRFFGKGQVVQCRCRELGSGDLTVVPSIFTCSVIQRWERRDPGVLERGVRWTVGRIRLKRWSSAIYHELSPNSVISTASRVFASGDWNNFLFLLWIKLQYVFRLNNKTKLNCSP